MLEFLDAVKWENKLAVGDPVEVRWGYGLGFRVEGKGTIDKVYPKSFRVKLTEDVASPGGGKWEEGFVLKGIPRRWNSVWHPDHAVWPVGADE